MLHRHDPFELHRVRRGELAFYLEGEDGAVTRHVAGPGTWVTLARGSLHHFRNVGPAPAKMLILATPAGLDRFFLETNPRAGEGNCIMTLAPVTIGQLLVGALRYGQTRAAAQLRGLRSAWAPTHAASARRIPV